MASRSERINSVKSDIQALVTYANETTGEADTTISDVVQTLLDGYGTGADGHYFETSFIVPDATGSIQYLSVKVPYDKSLRKTHGTNYYIDIEYMGELPSTAPTKNTVIRICAVLAVHSNTYYVTGNTNVWSYYVDTSNNLAYSQYVGGNAILITDLPNNTQNVQIQLPALTSSYATIAGEWKLRLLEIPGIHTW